MNLSRMLAARAEEGRPIRIGQVGAGKFGTMFLAQLRLTRGMHLVGLADLLPERARERLGEVGWPLEQVGAATLDRCAEVRRQLRHGRCDVADRASGN